MLQLRCLFILAILSCWAGLACDSTSGPSMESREEARRIWREHIAVMRQIAAGGAFDQERFAEVVDYLETTTGIPSRHDGTFVGKLPTEHLEKDLERWEAWFADNNGEVYWTEKQSV